MQVYSNGPAVRIIPVEGYLPPDALSRLARQALLDILCVRYGIGELPEIGRHPGGKPYFPGISDLHFSLSHCRSAVMAVTDRYPVGCDIEEVLEELTPELLEVAFSAEEQRLIALSSDPRLEATCIWTQGSNSQAVG